MTRNYAVGTRIEITDESAPPGIIRGTVVEQPKELFGMDFVAIRLDTHGKVNIWLEEQFRVLSILEVIAEAASG